MILRSSQHPIVSSDEMAAAPGVLGGSCCVITHKQFFCAQGRYYSSGGFNKYVEVLRRIFDRVILAMPVSDGDRPASTWALKDGLAEIVELPTCNFWHGAVSLLHPVKFGVPIVKAMRQADVVHVIMPGYIQVLGFAAAKMLGKRMFCSLVGDWEGVYLASPKARRYPRLVGVIVGMHRILLRWILRSGLVFVHGRPLAERYRRIGVRVVENQSSTFSSSDIRRPADLGPVHNPPRLLFVGRIQPEKGLPVLVRAIRQLRDEGLPVELTIVGDGSARESIEELSRQLGLGDAVDLRGFVPVGPDLWSVYRQHDVFVLPSLTEGAPKVIIEAQANALPIVATLAGGIPGMVEPEGGILVPPGDANAMAKAIRDVLADSERRLGFCRWNLGAAAKRTLESQVMHMADHIRQEWPGLFRNRTSDSLSAPQTQREND